MKKVRLGIFISGAGSNAKKITEKFLQHTQIEVVKIISNNSHSPLLHDEKVGHLVEFVPSEEMTKSADFVARCQRDFDFIILAGYLKKIQPELIQAFPHRIFNIHPAILPNYGGKGMYGMHVHQAVFENHEKLSGITIHFVNEIYDSGQFIAHFFTNIENCSSPEQIQREVQKLEHSYYGDVIEKTILNY